MAPAHKPVAHGLELLGAWAAIGVVGAAVALHYMHYNFARIHRTLRVTPAMQAGLSDHVWSIEEIVGLLDQAKREPAA